MVAGPKSGKRKSPEHVNGDSEQIVRRVRRKKRKTSQKRSEESGKGQAEMEQTEQSVQSQTDQNSVKAEKHARVWKYVSNNLQMVNPSYESGPSFAFNVIAAPPAVNTRQLEVTVFNRKMQVLLTCEARSVEEWIKKQDGELYGVDIEWKPNRQRGVDNRVALLQICNEKECLLIQTLFLDRIPEALVKFLRDPSKKLGGIGIRQDAKKLERDFEWECQGTVELAPLAVEKLKNAELSGTGLKKLALAVLGLQVEKPKWVTMSNWAKRKLDRDQVNYACVDAWLSYALLHKLLSC